jgi:hypothetical protein
MYQKLKNDMDINCGAILDGEVDVQQMGQRIFEAILRHASGREDQERGAGPGRPRVRAVAPGHRELSALGQHEPSGRRAAKVTQRPQKNIHEVFCGLCVPFAAFAFLLFPQF